MTRTSHIIQKHKLCIINRHFYMLHPVFGALLIHAATFSSYHILFSSCQMRQNKKEFPLTNVCIRVTPVYILEVFRTKSS